MNLDDYAWQKFQIFFSKMKNMIAGLKTTHLLHSKALHCAEKKAFAHKTWTTGFFHNL